MERHGTPNWHRAVRAGQAPQLPSLVIPEERFNPNHGFHGEFSAGAGAKPGSAPQSGGSAQSTQQAPLVTAASQVPAESKTQEIASLIAEAEHLEALARNDLDQASNIQKVLNTVLAELQSLTAPFPAPSSSQLAAPGQGLTSNPAGTPNTAASAQTGTPSTSKTAAGASSNAQGGQSYADRVMTLQGQASAYQSQVAQLQNQAADYNFQAGQLRAQAKALGGTPGERS